MEKLKLNIGSNNVRIPGFLNVDIIGNDNVDIVADAKSLPQDDNSVDEILSCHMIEHLDYYDGLKAIEEWYRVLRPGGKLVIECPDFEAFCKNFIILPENERCNYYAQVFGFPWEAGQGHKFGYTPQQMIWSLEGAGFVNISKVPALRYCNLEKWCMKFECIKPVGLERVKTSNRHILCVVPTKERYMTTLPMTLSTIVNQNVKPDEVIIFDDSKTPIDLRTVPLFANIFRTMDDVGIKWSVLFGTKRGQHFSHQKSQEIARDLIWRVDDDEIPNLDVLEILLSNMKEGVGAVAGLVLQPNSIEKECKDNPIDDVNDNCQWYRWTGKKEVQHLYSSFLYRKDIAEYELSLSAACHREETIFTHRMYRKGYKLIVDSKAVTTHLRNSEGGIRTYGRELFEHDEKIFGEIRREWSGDMICYLDNGKGDHVVFSSILPEIKSKYKRVRIACCFPDLFEGEEVISIDEGKKLITPDRMNIYKFMADRNWKSELLLAFRKMYIET